MCVCVRTRCLWMPVYVHIEMLPFAQICVSCNVFKVNKYEFIPYQTTKFKYIQSNPQQGRATCHFILICVNAQHLGGTSVGRLLSLILANLASGEGCEDTSIILCAK